MSTTPGTTTPVSATESAYLVGLNLVGKRVVVVGGGSVTQRRLPLLIESGAHIQVIAPAVTPAVEALADSRQIELLSRAYSHGDLAQAWYVIAATDDADVNAAVVAEADRLRVFCVRADLGSAGSAVTPATTRHDGVTLGILAGGDHRRSAALRTALSEALSTGAVDDSAEPMAAGVALVGGGPGDPELITVRGRRLLVRADVVITDRLGPASLLGELGAGVEVIDASKIPYGRAMAQERINELLIEHARAGKFVVRLKGGDPYLFGRGFEELIALTHAGIPVTVVPGITSALAVPAAANVPVTHRGITHELTIVSGHLPPGHPDSLLDWDVLAKLNGTIVLMMGVGKLKLFTDALIAGGRDAATPVAIIQEGTTAQQRVLRADLATIAERVEQEQIKPPAITVIGAVAGLADLLGGLG
ncbi:uroporphyrinogen-III C-methyltransferase [Tomitella biformata]|uniref:uroporphyrinogen-III C-methyltransferase n=1 Tax=Tomitella biformata TaxID=630403 RepID=UPI0004B8DD80|nr:uroporphyrinogen-III C-methyltransferase [Tomitella biformata]